MISPLINNNTMFNNQINDFNNTMRPLQRTPNNNMRLTQISTINNCINNNYGLNNNIGSQLNNIFRYSLKIKLIINN